MKWDTTQFTVPTDWQYVETSCFQALQFGNCLQSFPKLWLQMVQKKWKTSGSGERRLRELFFEFAASITA